MDYAIAIRAEIDHHYAEITKLQTALEVIERMSPGGKGTKAKTEPLFTVRRSKPALLAPGGQQRREKLRDDDGKTATEQVRAFVRNSVEPFKSGDVIEQLGWRGDTARHQRVYAALNQLAAKGEITRDERGFYFLVKPTRGETGESQSADAEGVSESARAA